MSLHTKQLSLLVLLALVVFNVVSYSHAAVQSSQLIPSRGRIEMGDGGIRALSDDFEDNVIDSTIWEVLLSEGTDKSVIEQNGRLECYVNGASAKAGLITQVPYDLSESYVEIQPNTREAMSTDIGITIQKPQQGETIWWMEDWYLFRAMLDDQDVGVFKSIGGQYTYVGSFSWQSPTSRLRITLSGNTISFHEDDKLIYEEPYGLPSTQVYINIFAGAGKTGYFGTNYIEQINAGPVNNPEPRVLGKLYIQGRHFYVDGQKIYLRGVNKFGGNRYDGRHEYASDYAYMAKWGINVVRRHFRAQWWFERESYRQIFDNNIQWAADNNQFFIMDLYTWGDSGRSDAKVAPSRERWAELWVNIANRYKDKWNVIYEIANEPHSWSESTYYSWAQYVINEIRKVDPVTVIIVPLYDWAHDGSYVANNPLSGGNIAYDTHWYYRFSSRLGTSYSSVSSRYDSEARVDDILKHSPIINGEFGVDSGYSSGQMNSFRSQLEVMRDREMSWMAYCWDVYPGSGFYLIESYDTDSLSDFTPSGKAMLEFLP